MERVAAAVHRAHGGGVVSPSKVGAARARLGYAAGGGISMDWAAKVLRAPYSFAFEIWDGTWARGADFERGDGEEEAADGEVAAAAEDGRSGADLERLAARRPLRPSEVASLERADSSDGLSAAFCRRRWGGPATRAEFEEVSAKWLEITVATMECALLKQCEWAGGAKAPVVVADHERAGGGLSSYVL